jgi:hypothetical protein
MNSREDDRQASIAAEWATGASRAATSAATPESSHISEWASTTEVTTGSGGSQRWPTRRFPSRLASSRLAERINAVSDLRARRLAAVTLLIAFVLVVVAQWKPWFRLDSLGVDFGNTDRDARSIDAINALYALVIPYYVGWMLIAMASGAAVFGRKRIRRTAAGIAAGALAGQALVVLATWHDDGIGVYRGLTSPLSTLHGQRQSGIYLAAAALAVTAAALVIAVRGRIIPMADDDDAATTPAAVIADEPHAPGPRKGVRAGAPWVDGGEDLDDEAGGHSRSESAYANGHQPTERSGETAPVTPRSEAPDHSLYMRPQDAKVNY